MRVEPTNQQGRLVGRYVVHERIAAGGMATVHLGRLLGPAGFSRTVAIKRLHDSYSRDPEFVAMLLDEARLAATIRHPNVVPTLDVVAETDELLVVMDYIEGDSLAHLAKLATQRNERFPVAYAAMIVAQALQGLHAAHEARDKNGDHLGIVHRDVSPQNILVGVDGVARVLDFGIAKAASRATSTEDGQVKGKTPYMAPEQLQHGAVDRRTDIFAASVCLWELCANRRLFLADSPAETMSRVLNMPVEPPQKFAPDVPAAVGDVILKGLERDPDKRWSTAEEMAHALEDALAMPRAKELGAWVAQTAAQTLNVRAELVREVERSSHRIEAASGTTDPELRGAIEEAERRRQVTEMPTDVGGGKPLASPQPYVTPRSNAGAMVMTPRSGAVLPTPGAEFTQLSTSNTSHGFSQPPPPRTSRVSLVLGFTGALAILVALGIAFIATRPPASAGPTHVDPSAAPPSVVPPAPIAATSASGSATATASASASSSAKPPKPPKGGVGVRPSPKKCDPPYDVDADGNKHYKVECL